MSEVSGGWQSDEPDEEVRYKLRLYVAGAAGNSSRAIANLRAVCEAHLAGRYDLEVVDVHQDYGLAGDEQIVALPMLIRLEPSPTRRLIGDMSNTEKLMKGLGITN